jgi:hypothetical protein
VLFIGSLSVKAPRVKHGWVYVLTPLGMSRVERVRWQTLFA